MSFFNNMIIQLLFNI